MLTYFLQSGGYGGGYGGGGGGYGGGGGGYGGGGGGYGGGGGGYGGGGGFGGTYHSKVEKEITCFLASDLVLDLPVMRIMTNPMRRRWLRRRLWW